MADQQKIQKRYDYLIDTLIMINPDFMKLSKVMIEDYIEELEGDHVSFLDISNVQVLLDNELLDNYQTENLID